MSINKQGFNIKYIGHIGRPFCIRFEEPVRDYNHGNGKYKFAHLLDNKHSVGSLEEIKEFPHITKKKDEIANNLERFHIYNETKLDNQIIDKCAIKSNVILNKTIQKELQQRALTTVTSYACLEVFQSQVATQWHTRIRQPFQNTTKAVCSHVRSHRFAGHIFITN